MTRSRRAPAQRPLQPAAFVDRTMAAVRLETPPTPARALGDAVRRRSSGDAVAALAVAWHLATVRAWRVAPSVRARSIALVLAVALALVSGSLAAAGAVRLASEPVSRLFQAHVDDRGPLVIPPATVDEPRNIDPDEGGGLVPAGEHAVEAEGQPSTDRTDREKADENDDADGSASTTDDEQGGNVDAGGADVDENIDDEDVDDAGDDNDQGEHAGDPGDDADDLDQDDDHDGDAVGDQDQADEDADDADHADDSPDGAADDEGGNEDGEDDGSGDDDD